VQTAIDKGIINFRIVPREIHIPTLWFITGFHHFQFQMPDVNNDAENIVHDYEHHTDSAAYTGIRIAFLDTHLFSLSLF
jgi:hypothetical protein